MASTLELALQWRTARAARLVKQKEVDSLEKEEKVLKEQIISLLSKAKNKSVSNGDRLFQLVLKQEPFCEDWPTLYEHVKKTGEFDLLFRRINPAAVKERWDQGAKVPGIGKVPVETLSDTGAK